MCTWPVLESSYKELYIIPIKGQIRLSHQSLEGPKYMVLAKAREPLSSYLIPSRGSWALHYHLGSFYPVTFGVGLSAYTFLGPVCRPVPVYGVDMEHEATLYSWRFT